MIKKIVIVLLSIFVVLTLVVLYFFFKYPGRLNRTITRSARLGQWLKQTDAHPDWMVKAGDHCGDAPFIFPTSGYVGFLWDDSFRIGHRHQGIDTFTSQGVGKEPVISVYDGYLTRLADWKSSVIIRIPDDPLHPGRQIWTYYTHMADDTGKSFIVSDFPAGTNEVFVPAGTLLGYQGDYSGTPGNPTGIHLHFSIVLDDGEGKFRNELEIKNTLDPSAYFNLNLNANQNLVDVVVCK